MEITWKPANRKDKTILFYGYASEKSVLNNVEIDYKIIKRWGKYMAFKKEGKKYLHLASRSILVDVQNKCLTNLRMRGEHGK